MFLWHLLGSSHLGTKLVLSVLNAIKDLFIFVIIPISNLNLLLISWNSSHLSHWVLSAIGIFDIAVPHDGANSFLVNIFLKKLHAGTSILDVVLDWGEGMFFWKSLWSSHLGTKFVLGVFDALKNFLVVIIIEVLSLKESLLIIWFVLFLILMMLVVLMTVMLMMLGMVLFVLLLLSLLLRGGILLHELVDQGVLAGGSLWLLFLLDKSCNWLGGIGLGSGWVVLRCWCWHCCVRLRCWIRCRLILFTLLLLSLLFLTRFAFLLLCFINILTIGLALWFTFLLMKVLLLILLIGFLNIFNFFLLHLLNFFLFLGWFLFLLFWFFISVWDQFFPDIEVRLVNGFLIHVQEVIVLLL